MFDDGTADYDEEPSAEHCQNMDAHIESLDILFGL